MRRGFRLSLIATCVVAAAAMAIATTGTPEVFRMILGLLLVFVLPGYALECAAVPQHSSSVERLLATAGLSLAVAICTAVLLAALPVGLSRESLALTLGGLTIVLSVCAAFRTAHSEDPSHPRESA